MTNPSPSPAGAPDQGLDAVKAWRHDAARRMGAADPVARHFGETGLLMLEDKPLTLQPLSQRPQGPWIASVRAGRPAGVGEAQWCDALLLANSQSMFAMQCAFGLADDGDAVLVLRTPDGLDDPALLGAEVAGLLALRRSVVEGVATSLPPEVDEQLRAGIQAAFEAPPEASSEGDGEPESEASRAQQFEAPEEVLVKVHAAMLHLGRSPAQALAAARTGSLQLDGRRIGLACDIDGEHLIVAAELDGSTLATASRRRAAVAANTELMAFVGMAVARAQGQARLVTRWQLKSQSAENLARALRDLARLADAIVERHAAAANH